MRRNASIWILLPLLFAVACGGTDQSETNEAVEEAVEQVADTAAKIIAKADEVDDQWPFTLREVDAMRITNRVEYPMRESWQETLLEYQRPGRTRDVTKTGSAGKEPTVAERIFTTENSYIRIGDKWTTMPASQDPVAQIDEALRLNTSADRLESAHKARQVFQEMEGREELDGKEMLVYYQDDLKFFLEGEEVTGYQRTWVGADDGLVYKIVREAKSDKGHEISTSLYEYGGVTIEIPEG
jgi:hypothetical protein